MSRAVRTLIIGALSALTLGALAGPARANIWTPIPSGTNQDITAIEYQGPDRFWFTTGDGKIYKRVAGTFQEKQSVPGVVFRDIEFQQGGLVGLAVGTNGGVWRSTNAGDNWTGVAVNTLTSNAVNENDCDEPGPVGLGDAESVRFNSTGDRAWIAAGGSQIATSAGTAATVGTVWTDANDSGGTDCRITHDIDDIFPVPASTAVYFVSKYFGQIWFSNNNLTSSGSIKAGDAGNGFEQTRRLAGDPANPNRQWSVAPNGTGGSYYSRTETGWSSANSWDIGNPDTRDLSKAFDVDYAGGTVLAAGQGGMILHSIDGRNFFFDDATGFTEDWHAVSLADGVNGAVGGSNGQLVITSQANVIPDITKPTGTISGPATASAGAPVSFTLNAADTGGSGLNLGSFAWTSAGLPGRSGQTISYTFPSPGFYTVRVTFADNAGNTGEADKSITVGRAVAATLPVSFSGPGNTLTARIRGSRIIVTMKGTIKPPAGANVRAACRGKVNVQVKKGKRNIVSRTVKLKLKKGKCRFSKRISLSRKKVGKTKKLKLRVSFRGNTVLKAGSKTVTLVIRK